MFEYLITRPMGFIIEHIYNLVSNYGLAIIIFTILIKLILIPLNIHSQKAMKKQQKIKLKNLFQKIKLFRNLFHTLQVLIGLMRRLLTKLSV